MRGQGGIGTIFTLFGVILIFVVIGYMISLILPALPHGTSTVSNNIIQNYSSVKYISHYAYTFVDYSIIIVVFIFLALDVAVSYFRHNKALALINIILIFTLGYIMKVFDTVLKSLNILNANTILPLTYNFAISPYLIMIMFFFLIFATILNLRGEND